MPENAIGLAKSADVGVDSSPPVHGELVDRAYVYDGVPMEIYNYFDVDIKSAGDREKRQLREIFSSLKDKSRGIDDVMSKIILLDHKLGAPSGRDNRWSAIWSFLKTLGVINATRNN